MSDNFVAFLMGSDSDFPVVEPGIEILKNLGIRCEVSLENMMASAPQGLQPTSPEPLPRRLSAR